jgi:hypothetical protein
MLVVHWCEFWLARMQEAIFIGMYRKLILNMWVILGVLSLRCGVHI